MSLQDRLKNIKRKDIKRSKSSLPTYMTAQAKVVKVHDGDTCDLVIIRNSGLERFKCRLAGIDTRELKDGTPALKARDFLMWLSCGRDPSSFPRSSQPLSNDQIQSNLDANKQLVYAEFQGTGGYGRPLVILKKNQNEKKSFNDLLIDYGHAKKYR